MFSNPGFGVKRILWPIHPCASLFQTFSIYSLSPRLPLPCRTTDLAGSDGVNGQIGVSVIPARPLHIALFISELTAVSISNNTGISPIESVVYGIKWGHSLAGIVECPTGHPLVKSSLEGARRKLALPVQPKEPLSVDTVLRIAEYYISSYSFSFLPLGWLCWVFSYGRNSQFDS